MEVDSDFEFSRQLLPDPTLASADELFDRGLIRPLKPFRSFPPTAGHLSPIEVTGLQLQRNQAKEPGPRPDHPNRITSRSISPLRISEFANSTNSSSSSSSSSSMGGLKGRLKDLTLFRSASEGRPLNNYPVSSLLLGWKSPSFNRETSSRRFYYRANSVEELKKKKKMMKKKTSFSYKQSILGCMGFSSSSSSSSCGHHQELSSGFGHCFS